MKYLNIYSLIINLFAFIMFGIDKQRSKNNNSRISEKTLFLLSVIGGGIGSFVAMQVFKHKNRKWYFNLIIPFCIILGIIEYYYIFRYIKTHYSI